MNKYTPKDIEKKWQTYWEENTLYKTPEDITSEDKFYILPQLPYPSGSGLHVGHAEVYNACDIYARYQRMQGKKVLQVIGWDSFGLPAENYAIKTNVHPRESTNTAVDNFRHQIKTLGISVDWDREVGSHNPDYYKWTQWFFQLFYKQGLAYRKKQSINWCESCKTVLANAQVVDGRCERSDDIVVQKEMEQWYIKITDYADKLLEGLERIDWPEETKKRQRDWIGRSEGAELDFAIAGSEETIRVFTTRPDTLFGATYMVLAPEHELIQKLSIENRDEVQAYMDATAKRTELERQSDTEKTGVELKGVKAINPVNGEEIPVWIADYVLATYGTGAIMAVPGHDERDWEFANKFGLSIAEVVAGGDIKEAAHTGDGELVNSEFLNGMNKTEAISKMIDWLEEKGIGNKKVQYKLRDWSVSRQRFWGAPVPMLYDENGEIHLVPEEDLPVILPDDVDFKPTGESPLNYSPSFQAGVEDKYGKGWKREVDTLDTFMCSSWYYYRYLDPKNDNAFASPEALKAWMPVDFYLGGEEHVNGHLLYARFFTKVLHDAGYIDFDEPFTKHRHQGLILAEDNRKMSKRWGNVINPTDVVNEFGADTIRTYQMFMGPLEDTKPWSTDGVRGVRKFLDRVWRLQEKIGDAESEEVTVALHKTIKKVSDDMQQMKFNTAVAKMMECTNTMTKAASVTKTSLETFIKLLAPFAPHMSEEVWANLGNEPSVTMQDWPTHDESKLVEDEITLAVQVNGKVRAKITVPADMSEDDIKAKALAQENVTKWLEGNEPKKIIYVKGRLVSVVV